MVYLGAAGGPELRAPAAPAAGDAGPATAGAGQHEAGAGQGEEGGGQVQGPGDTLTCILQTPGPAGEQGGVTVTTETSHQEQDHA